MSEEELVQAYLDGQVTRRVFIRRLVGMGISFAAAVSYSSILRSSPALADTPDNDFYDLYDFYCDPSHHDLVGVGVRDDNKFRAKDVQLTPGDRVGWLAPPINKETHTVTDTTGMGLFNATLPPGSGFTFQFKAAGRYTYRSTRAHDPGMTGSVNVRPVVQPASGSETRTFTLAWACSRAPAGFVYDVQVQRPGGPWQILVRGTTSRLRSFVPDAGPGAYAVRARLRKLSNDEVASFVATPFVVS